MDTPGGEGAIKPRSSEVRKRQKRRITVSPAIVTLDSAVKLTRRCQTSLKVDGVLFVLPDFYMDPEYKDYVAELFVNGEIVQRSPESQRTVDPVPPRTRDRPKYNDRARYVRPRENMG